MGFLLPVAPFMFLDFSGAADVLEISNGHADLPSNILELDSLWGSKVHDE